MAVLATRLVAGTIFIAFGIGKFIAYDTELASFEAYGLPWPEGMVYAVGSIEVTGGLLLVLGLLNRPVALILAANMVVAIVVSGIGEGEAISLTLAPALLIAMVMLLRLGPGDRTMSRRERN